MYNLILFINLSDRDDNIVKLLNIYFIEEISFIFHLEISGKEDSFEQFENILLKLVILLLSQFEISGIDVNDLQE
jgi:hypothetical protein